MKDLVIDFLQDLEIYLKQLLNLVVLGTSPQDELVKKLKG